MVCLFVCFLPGGAIVTGCFYGTEQLIFGIMVCKGGGVPSMLLAGGTKESLIVLCKGWNKCGGFTLIH